jgi:type III secretion protein L
VSQKKIFSLITGKEIHFAPNSKIISEGDFSVALDAIELFETTEKESELYRKQVVQECEQIKELAEKEGFEAGMQEWADQLACFEEKVKTIQTDLNKMIVPIALTAAKKVVGREIEIAPETILDIVANNIKPVTQHRKIVIYVNKKELEILEKNRTKLKSLFENLESLSIRERQDVAMGGCIIETEKGIINAQIDRVWDALERAFEKANQKLGPI